MMKFWESKQLAEMTAEEWESLCDGCGKCCLHKLEDEETGQIAMTRVACRLLDLNTCRCSNYGGRFRLVPDCINLRQHDFAEYKWLPETCAYRLLSVGEKLPVWHPLISGQAGSTRQAGMTVTAYAVKEEEVDDMEDHIISWLE